MKKRISAILLAALMVASILPTFAASTDYVRTVGVGKEYATLTDAVNATLPGDATSVTFEIYGDVDFNTFSDANTNGYHHGDCRLAPSGVTVNVVGKTSDATVTIVGGGVPDIVDVNLKNLTVVDEGAYLPNANEFMYQNFGGTCTFENVVFEDGVRLGTSYQGTTGNFTVTGCTFNASGADVYTLWLDAGTFVISNSKLNVTDNGYGMVKSDAAPTLTLNNNTFQNHNESTKEALNIKNATVTASNNTFIAFEEIMPKDKSNTVNGQPATGETADNAIKSNNSVLAAPPAYAGPVMNWVKVNAADNGVVKSGPLAASADATVTLYPKAAEGYVLDTVEVLDAEGNAVVLDGLKFAIPAGGVTVNATFKLAD